MKDFVIKVLFVLLLVVFAAKILSLNIDFPPFPEKLINATMFFLIGIAYTFIGIDKKMGIIKGLYILSGLTLIIWTLVGWTLAGSFRVKFIVLLGLLIPLALNSRLLRRA